MPPRPAILTFVTASQSQALAIQNKLKENGQNATVTEDNDGNIKVDCIVNFKDLSSMDMMKYLENDPEIDADSVDIEYNFANEIVDTDVNIAKSQASMIKFSYIPDQFNTRIGSTNLDELKLDDTDDIATFFESVEQKQFIPNVNGNDMKAQEIKEMMSEDKQIDDDPVAKWWFNQTAMLKETIENQFIQCAEEYELKAINLLFNPKHAILFMKHKDCVNSKLMFHGTSLKAFKGIFENGFKLSKKSIGKFYGIGHYFTPQILHSIRYLTMCKDARKYWITKNNHFTVIAAFVNPGNVKQVKGLEYKNKPIAKSYDSHHVQVTDGIHGVRGIGAPIYKGYDGEIMEEYSIKDSTRILPRFYITLKRVDHIFVWRDKNIHNKFNGGLLKEFESYDGKIYGVTDTETALNIIKLKMKKNKVFVITNGAHDGELFVKSVREDLKLKTQILVFCSAIDYHSKWAAKYNDVIVQSGRSNIIKFVKSKYESQEVIIKRSNPRPKQQQITSKEKGEIEAKDQTKKNDNNGGCLVM